MNASSPGLVDAYLLYQRPYRETSVIADFVTADDQHLRAVCKGVRSANRSALRSRSALQLFARCAVAFSGRTELKNLRQIEALDSPAQLSGEVLYSALYVNELTVRLCRTDGIATGIYRAYSEVLEQLVALDSQARSTGDIDKKMLEVVLRRFEFSLMRLCGYEIDWYSEAETGEPINATASYRFDPDRGFVRVEAGVSGNAAELTAIPGAVLVNIAEGNLEQRQAQQFAKRIVREALKPLLAGKPLKSRELFSSL